MTVAAWNWIDVEDLSTMNDGMAGPVRIAAATERYFRHRQIAFTSQRAGPSFCCFIHARA